MAPAERGAWKTPARVRAAFFDVDGTLLSLAQNRVPESAAVALTRLRASGVTPVLATGRTHYLLDKVDLTAFDAAVTFNGQLVEVGERVVHSNPLDPKDVASVVRQVERGAFECLFMERDRMYLSGANELTRAMEELTHNHFVTSTSSTCFSPRGRSTCCWIRPPTSRPRAGATSLWTACRTLAARTRACGS